MKPVILILISLFVLSGCSLLGTKEPEIQLRTVLVPIDVSPPARPEPVDVVTVDWQVLPARTTTVAPIIGLSPTDYESMILFNFDVMRYIRQLQALVAYYERSIEQHNTRVEARNSGADSD